MIPRRRIYTAKGELFKIIKMSLGGKDDLRGYIKEFEENFKCFIGTEYAVAVKSGRDGLRRILESLELERGEEVIIPAYTLKDLIPIIVSLGLKPVPADIDPHTFNIDYGSIIKRITKNTKVILATHIFGAPCQIDRILDIAKERSIFVIEDCAHSLGSEFNGRMTGSFGDAAFFSFETIKPVNTYGGGMVVTNNERIASCVRKADSGLAVKNGASFKKIITAFSEQCLLGTPLSFPGLYLLASRRWHEKIFNFYRTSQRLSASKNSFGGIQAFLGMEKLKTLKERVARRREKADLFKSLLDLRSKPQRIIEKSGPNYYFFVSLLSADAWRTRKILLMHGIDAGIKAEIADDCAAFLGYKDCPNAKEVFERAIQLPLYESLTDNDIYYIAGLLNKNR